MLDSLKIYNMLSGTMYRQLYQWLYIIQDRQKTQANLRQLYTIKKCCETFLNFPILKKLNIKVRNLAEVV